MTLRRRTALIVCLAMAFVVAVLLAFGWIVVGRGFDDLEDEYASRNSDRAVRAIQNQVGQLDTTALDWANWDDTYAFLLGEDPEYVDSNLGPDSLYALKLDYLAIFDNTGEAAYEESIDRSSAEVEPIPPAARQVFGDLAAGAPESAVAGIADLDGEHMLIAIRPVLRSDDSGPAAGYLVMGRWLDESLLAELSDLTISSVSVEHVEEESELAAALAAGDVFSLPLDDGTLASSIWLPALDSDDFIALHTVSDRDIVRKGQSVMVNLAVLLGLAAAAFGLLTFALLEVGVVRRLRRLGAAVHSIGSRADIRARLDIDSPDELGRLATDINHMLASLESAEIRYRELVDRAAEGIVLLHDGLVSFANPAAKSMLHLDDAPGDLRLADHFVPESRDAFLAAVTSGAVGDVDRFEATLAGDSERILTVTLMRLAPSQHQAVLHDVTDAVEANRRRQETERQMLESQRLESLGLLAGGIAHDFNNLLTVVIGSATILEDMTSDGEARALLSDLTHAAARAAELTHQLLAYAGKSTTQLDLLDISGLANETTSLVRRVAGKHATITASLGSALPAVRADSTQVRQVLMNLLTNAADALPGGKGTIAVSTGTVSAANLDQERLSLPATSTPDLWVYVEVADSGAGMDEATREHMFDPFYSTKGNGRGLGLAATAGILRASGGCLNVESTPTRGTTVRAYFPAVRGTEASLSSGGSGDADSRRVRGTGNILVVDDEEAVRNVAVRFLKRAGFTVTDTGDGRQALAEVPGWDFDLVILDVAMPGMDGPDVVRNLRAAGIETPVVLISGYSPEALPTGPEIHFLQKPFVGHELVELVHAIIRPRAA